MGAVLQTQHEPPSAIADFNTLSSRLIRIILHYYEEFNRFVTDVMLSRPTPRAIMNQPQPETSVSKYLREESSFRNVIMSDNGSLVKDLVNYLGAYLKTPETSETLYGLRFRQPIFSGSVVENLKVCHPDEFDVILPFKLGHAEELWSISPDTSTAKTSYQPYYVHRRNPSRLSNPRYDALSRIYGKKHLPFNADVYDKICPAKFYNHLKNIIVRGLRQMESDCNLSWSFVGACEYGPAITISVKNKDTNYTVTLDLVPTVEVVTNANVCQVKTLTLKKSKPKLEEVTVLMVPKGGTHWRRSYSLEEENLIHTHSANRDSSLFDVLRAVKTLASPQSPSPLRHFDSYVYKNAIFNFLLSYKKDIPLDQAFAEFMTSLQVMFQYGCIRRHFEPNTNLLANADPKKVRAVQKYLLSFNKDIDFSLEYVRFKRPCCNPSDGKFKLYLDNFYQTQIVDKNYKSTLGLVEEVEREIKALLQRHFEATNFKLRFKLDFNRIISRSFLPNSVALPDYEHLNLLVVFSLNGNAWIPQAVQSNDKIYYNCVWADDTLLADQANKYGYKDYGILDWYIFTRSSILEITSAFRNNVPSQFQVRESLPYVKVKFNLHNVDVTWLITSAVTFQSNDMIDKDLILTCPPSSVSGLGPCTTFWSKNGGEVIKRTISELDKFDFGCRLKVLEILLKVLATTPLACLGKVWLPSLIYKKRFDFRWSLHGAIMTRDIFAELKMCLTMDEFGMPFTNDNLFRYHKREDLELCRDFMTSFQNDYSRLFDY